MANDVSPGFPIGYEFGYDQITAPAAITATASPGTDVIVCASHFFDGYPVLMEVFAPYCDYTGSLVLLRLFEGATNLGRIYDGRWALSTPQPAPVVAKYRFIPSVGQHAYTIKGQTGSGTAHLGAGTAISDDYLSAYVRFTKV